VADEDKNKETRWVNVELGLIFTYVGWPRETIVQIWYNLLYVYSMHFTFGRGTFFGCGVTGTNKFKGSNIQLQI
jgi:hypothetical protein